MFVAALALLILPSCDYFSLDDPVPVNSTDTQIAIIDRGSTEGAVAGVYDALQDPTLVFDGYMMSWQLHSDETVFTGTFPTRLEFGNLNVFPSNGTWAAAFSDFYDVINVANNIVETVPNVESPSLDEPGLRENFIAEARFARAIAYFYLVQAHGDVPLVLKPTQVTDIVGDILNVSTTPAAEVMDQVILDFEYAIDNLSGLSLEASPDGARGFLARIALYQERWADAYDLATQVLGEGFDLTQFDFLDDQVFSLRFNSTDGNSLAFFYGTSNLGGRHSIEPSMKLIDAYTADDLRAAQTFTFNPSGTPYGLKYDDFSAAVNGQGDDPVMFIRHAELVLIAAEAAARQGDFTDASMWINQVRSRAGLADVTLDAGNFEDLILEERFLELAMEGGHRLWDLRRTGRAESVLGGIGYDACDSFWGLPQRDIDRNPNLVQNGCCNC